MTSKRTPGAGPAEKPAPTAGKDTKPHVKGEPAPRLPHERDESADSQTSGPRPRIEQALADIENGLVDTDRGPVLDSVYEREMRAENDFSGTDRVSVEGPGEEAPGLSSPAQVGRKN